jgi:dihydrolipoyl dehydrogenase
LRFQRGFLETTCSSHRSRTRSAAFHAADKGMKVTLVDADPNPGGVCTFRGCIPSKALLHAAKLIEEAKHAEVFGMSFGRLSIDIAKLRGWKTPWSKSRPPALVCSSRRARSSSFQGRASIVDATTLRVETSGGERNIEPITSSSRPDRDGSRPAAVPGVSIDSPRALDSTTALDVPECRSACLSSAEGISGSSSEPYTPRSDPK